MDLYLSAETCNRNMSLFRLLNQVLETETAVSTNLSRETNPHLADYVHNFILKQRILHQTCVDLHQPYDHVFVVLR